MAALPRFTSKRAPGQIRGYDGKLARYANGTEVRDVISRLTYGHLDPEGRAGTISSKQTVRLDRQPNAGSGQDVCTNLQVQLNVQAGVNAGAGTTIGQVLVPVAVFLIAHHHPERNLRRQLERVVRSALNRSATANGAWYVIGVE